MIISGFGLKGKRKEVLFEKFINKFNIPTVSTWNAADILGAENKNYLGIIGMSGQRGANKAVFSADLLLCLGNHLSIPHTTTLYNDYAPNAKKIVIDIDKNELKNLNVKFDLKINDDVENFLNWSLKKNSKHLKFKWSWKYNKRFRYR